MNNNMTSSIILRMFSHLRLRKPKNITGKDLRKCLTDQCHHYVNKFRNCSKNSNKNICT